LSSHEFLALDLVRRGVSLPAQLREVGQALRKAGLIESLGHGRGSRYVLSPELYDTSRQPQLVDRDAAKATILKYIDEHRAEGSSMGELLEQFPSLSRDQMKALLKDLKAEGNAHTVGRTKGGRWYPGEAAE
jgi:ATP-dependent DNA helicase RecG